MRNMVGLIDKYITIDATYVYDLSVSYNPSCYDISNLEISISIKCLDMCVITY